MPFRMNLANHFTSGMTSMSISGDPNRPSPGFIHMAAALMAIEHFNSRNASVVPQLAKLGDCSIQFDTTNSRFFDTGTVGHLASKSLFQAGTIPCAIAGPFNDAPALDLSTMAQAADYSMVAHRSFNQRVVIPQFSPMTSMVYPDTITSASTLISFLQSRGRTNYVSILYPQSDFGVLTREILTVKLDKHSYTWDSAPFVDPEAEVAQVANTSTVEGLRRLRDRGFYTIVATIEDPLKDFPNIAAAAEELGMNDGVYFWVWYGYFDGMVTRNDDPAINKLLRGSAWVVASDLFFHQGANNSFFQAMLTQGPEFADLINSVNPIAEGEPGYIYATPDYFLNLQQPEYGSGYMYDAVMTVGIGACLAEQRTNSTAISGDAHLEGIRSVNFSGATGDVRFVNRGDYPGARDPSTVSWGVFNLYGTGMNSTPGKEGALYSFSDEFLPGQGWTSLVPFVFPDGRWTAPELLRRTPEQNYLNPALQVIGFVLFGIVVVSALATVVWVFIHREHRVLRAAQPYFLFVLSLGAVVFASAIIPMSFDESYGWSDQQLSAACMAVPWLVSLGHIITYGALFSKLWRINKVLQFSRRKIEVKHVAWPMAALLLAAIVDLSLWTGLDPLRWQRIEVDDFTGESIGQCSCYSIAAFAAPLAVIMLIPTFMAGFMAWKTKDVDDAYTESWWIFMLILLQVELFLVGAPVVAILRGVSVDGKYLGLVILLCAFPMSTLLLIMLPKVIAYRQAVTHRESSKPKRGERGNSRVSGVNDSRGLGISDVTDGENGTSSRQEARLSAISSSSELPGP